MKGSKTTKSKSRRQSLKAYLKRIVRNEKIGFRVIPFGLMLLDLFDDGQINGSLLNMVVG
jgi:hypothetical protein